ncbi:hypothetical protein FE257_002490 [Aspergillus nanangensis]|uniref:Uncharacterized protein n=1 Tax=Aspergillus nanangensis TaxID=2582783 RepID=A0AAD4CSV6_ASPNN|nr:hypothetical protein FE257_002490 [Aspergillus nanangensis]
MKLTSGGIASGRVIQIGPDVPMDGIPSTRAVAGSAAGRYGCISRKMFRLSTECFEQKPRKGS